MYHIRCISAKVRRTVRGPQAAGRAARSGWPVSPDADRLPSAVRARKGTAAPEKIPAHAASRLLCHGPRDRGADSSSLIWPRRQRCWPTRCCPSSRCANECCHCRWRCALCWPPALRCSPKCSAWCTARSRVICWPLRASSAHGPHGFGHADPAFRLGVEPERALSHALRRWRVRDRGARRAGVPGGALTGRRRTAGAGATDGRAHWPAAGEARPDRAGRGVGVAERGAAEYQAYAASSEQRGMRFSSSRIVSRAMAVS